MLAALSRSHIACAGRLGGGPALGTELNTAGPLTQIFALGPHALAQIEGCSGPKTDTGDAR